jgi:DUF4097 and DUF4098 domain-containing protein YvlB
MRSWDFDTPGPVRLDLELPFGRIDVDTDESATQTHVDLDGSGGDVQVKTASGDASMSEVHGLTHVQTASGDIAVQQAHGDVTVQGVSGDVWIKDARRSVHVNTVSGDQRVDAVVEGSIETQAVSGDILIGVRRGSRVYVDANTISGSTSSELNLSDAPDDDVEDGAAADEGPMVEVRAKTVSGDVSLVRAAAPTPTQAT